MRHLITLALALTSLSCGAQICENEAEDRNNAWEHPDDEDETRCHVCNTSSACVTHCVWEADEDEEGDCDVTCVDLPEGDVSDVRRDICQSAGNNGSPGSCSPSCCKCCKSGKACGDTCISSDSQCNTVGGCACNG